MKYFGWVKLDRSILEDMYLGRTTVQEFGVLTLLRIYADPTRSIIRIPIRSIIRRVVDIYCLCDVHALTLMYSCCDFVAIDYIGVNLMLLASLARVRIKLELKPEKKKQR